jgi:hypothetical protein
VELPAAEVRARRDFLRCLLALAGLAWVGAVLRLPTGVRFRGRAGAAPLDAAGRAVADLAADFARAHPEHARRIVRAVEASLPTGARFARPAHRVTLARARLLRARRVEAELAAGDVILLDGWVLARSEAAFAIYAHAQVGA